MKMFYVLEQPAPQFVRYISEGDVERLGVVQSDVSREGIMERGAVYVTVILMRDAETGWVHVEDTEPELIELQEEVLLWTPELPVDREYTPSIGE